MLLNNRGCRNTMYSACAATVLAAIGSGILSHQLACRIVSEQLRTIFHVMGGGGVLDNPAEETIAAGEAFFSEYGIHSDTAPQMFSSFTDIWRLLFWGMFILCVLVIAILSIVSLREHFCTCRELEAMRQDCSKIAERLQNTVSMYGEDFSSIRRVSDGVNLLAGRIQYLDEMLADERNFQKDFLTDFSHQLKTALAVVRLNTDLLTETVLSEEKQEQLMQEVNMNLDGMQELVLSALRLAKLNAGAIVYEKEKMPLAETCLETLRRFSPVLRKKGIALETKFSGDAVFSHDRLWICEAIGNLLQNMAEHGNCTQICMAVGVMPGAVKLTISDNGIGIPQSEIPHLFERFRKKDRGTGQNFGVGMEIAKKVIEAHQGSISVYSQEQRGTEFEIVFLT